MTATTPPMSIRFDATAQEKLKVIAARRMLSAHALKYFDETGLHASQDEVTARMDSWGTAKELPAPLCHL